MVTITNHEFLSVVFQNYVDQAWVCGFDQDPADPNNPQRWHGGVYSGHAKSQLDPLNNTYYCVSTFSGKRRSALATERLMILVVDDIGTKVDPLEWEKRVPQLPTYILETSPGSFHYGYAIAGGFEGHALATYIEMKWRNLVASIAASKKADARDLTRYVRLPVGVNTKSTLGKPFNCTLHAWDPKRIYRPEPFASQVIKVDKQEYAEALKGKYVGGATAPGAGALYDAPADDPSGWGQALDSHGLITTAHKPGTWDMRCPFEHEHTDRAETGCAYLGGGMFKCYHSHCQDRTHEDFQEQLKKDIPNIEHEVTKAVFDRVPETDRERELLDKMREQEEFETEHSELGAIIKRFVFLAAENKWFDLEHRITLPPEGLNGTLARFRRELADVFMPKRKGPLPQPAQSLQASDKLLVAQYREYAPGHGQFITNSKGAMGLNMWEDARMGLTVQPEELSTPRSRGVLSYFAKLIRQLTGGGKEGKVVLDWLAAIVGNQGYKPGWQILIISDPGLGKDTLLNIITGMLGAANVKSVDASSIRASYNDWAAHQVAAINELSSMSTAGRRGQASFYDEIKVYFTTPPNHITVNPKYGHKYDARNASAFFMFSNHDLPVFLEKGERRMMVFNRINCPNPLRDAPGGWAKFYRLVAANPIAHEIIASYLRERWRLMSQARRDAIYGDAPMTTAKSHIQDASVSPLDALAEEWCDPDQNELSLWTKKELQQRFEHEVRQRHGMPHATYQMFSQRLRAHGAFYPAGGSTGQVRHIETGQAKSVVWALYERPDEGLVRTRALSADHIRQLMAKERAGSDPDVTPMPGVDDVQDHAKPKTDKGQ